MTAKMPTMSDGDGHRQPHEGRAGDEQGEHDRLRRVGDGGEVVAREDGQRLDLVEALVDLVGVASGRPNSDPSGPVDGAPDRVRRLDRRRSGDEDVRRGVPEIAARRRQERGPCGPRAGVPGPSSPVRRGSGGQDRPAVSQALEVDGRAADLPVGWERGVDRRVDEHDPRGDAETHELGGRVDLVVAGRRRYRRDSRPAGTRSSRASGMACGALPRPAVRTSGTTMAGRS